MYFNHNLSFRGVTLAGFAVAGLAISSAVAAECIDTNTCLGDGALAVNENTENTAIGFIALGANTLGSENTAVGAEALRLNTRGAFNTAVGKSALQENTTGIANTATGRWALERNSTGSFNTAFGYGSLQINDLGRQNTAIGILALQTNIDGSFNTATGAQAMLGGPRFFAIGDNNTATGAFALMSIADGHSNTATGLNAARQNTTGDYNTAIGAGALKNNETGIRNVALGYQAGIRTRGSNNIVIGSGTKGKAAENGVIRIGSGTFQRKAFIAGVRGVKTSLANATAVFIDGNGQLGTIKSSRRFKEDIQPMGSVSERLFALKPVIFRYKDADDNGEKPVEFGLIAEDVAKVFPELVIYEDNGAPETVSYHLLATLLLNEFQKQHVDAQTQASRMVELEKKVAELANLQAELIRMTEVNRGPHPIQVAASGN